VSDCTNQHSSSTAAIAVTKDLHAKTDHQIEQI
jgi:hypothetical protein